MSEKAVPSTFVGGESWSHPKADDTGEGSSKAIEGARELATGVRRVAADVADHARKTAESQVSDNKTRAVDGLNSVATAIRKTGEHLRSQDQTQLTPYLDRAATQVDAIADYVRNRTIGEIAGEVQGFARREPALFLGGAFAAGLLGGRFLKSSTGGSAGSSRALGNGRSDKVYASSRRESNGGSYRSPARAQASAAHAAQESAGSPAPTQRTGAQPGAGGSDGVRDTELPGAAGLADAHREPATGSLPKTPGPQDSRESKGGQDSKNTTRKTPGDS